VRFALALIIALLLLPVATAAAAGETRIIVQRDPGLTAAERADIRQDADVELVEQLRVANTEVVVTDDPAAALARLRRDADVRYAQVDTVWRAFAPDPDRQYLWALENTGSNLAAFPWGGTSVADADMDVPEVWPLSTGSGATVAVVDTGVDSLHPDLAGAIAGGRNFVADRPAPDYADGNDHGTHVSGTIVARRDNGIGMVGIAPDSKVLALRVLNNAGQGNASDIANAFDYAGDQGIRIVNASLGGVGQEPLVVRDAIAAHPETLYVVAAGNGGGDGIGDDNDVTPTYPCAMNLPNVLCVGASTMNETVASFSNFGLASVDVFAPGELILSTVRRGRGSFTPDSAVFDGTSMASPAVAAAAALALAADPSQTAAQLKALLLSSGDPVAAYAAKSVSGRRANAGAAVTAASPSTPPDADGDGLPNAADPFPRGADLDGDGLGALDDACPTVSAPGTATGCPAPDRDSDGVPDASDACPDVAGSLSNGCSPPPPAAKPPSDRDGDGRLNALDACPDEPAATADGCPVPTLRGLTVAVSKRGRKATARVRTDRVATASLRIERKVCKRGRCTWKRVASRTVATRKNAATLTKRLGRGRYRVVARLSSGSGAGKAAVRSFRVR
jgi:subtilisin family serine protease